MSVPSVLIPNPHYGSPLVSGFQTAMLEVKLGRIRPTAVPQVPLFRAYFSPAGATPPPPKVVYSAKAAAALKRMYMNDQLGCCVITGKAHQVGVWTGNDGPAAVEAADDEIVSEYHAICGPGDNGCIITRVLDTMKGRGLNFGGQSHKIDGYVLIDHANKLEVQVAAYLFGSLTLGVNLPSEWANGARPGFVWDATNSRIVGGHDVCVVGYDEAGVQISTWGMVGTITWRAFADRRWVEECYAQLSPDWYGNDKLAPCGVNAALLAADLAKLGGGVIPPIDPVEPPPPPPPPPPAGLKTYTVTVHSDQPPVVSEVKFGPGLPLKEDAPAAAISPDLIQQLVALLKAILALFGH